MLDSWPCREFQRASFIFSISTTINQKIFFYQRRKWSQFEYKQNNIKTVADYE